jgi:hypothetical protein
MDLMLEAHGDWPNVNFANSVSAEEIIDRQRVVEGKVCRITLMLGHDEDQGDSGEFADLPERLKLLRAHLQGKELIEQHLAEVDVDDHTTEVLKGMNGYFKQEASIHEKELISGAWRDRTEWIQAYRNNARIDYDALHADKEDCCKAPSLTTCLCSERWWLDSYFPFEARAVLPTGRKDALSVPLSPPLSVIPVKVCRKSLPLAP